ncbi:MAG: hypothetical protein AAF549_03810 [Pseudomonadota bacterium]
MANFDIISAAGYAYEKSWKERNYLAKLVFVPFVIKTILYILALNIFEPDDILKLTLVMLPAYFVEGWMLSHWVRTLLTDHRWPFVPSGDLKKDQMKIEERAKGVLAGTLSFVVINFLMAGFFAAVFFVMPPDMDPEQADALYGSFALGVIIIMFVLFRFTWIYIPAALNIPLKKYIHLTNPVMFTLSLIGVWLVCFIPPMMIMQLVASIGLSATGAESETVGVNVFEAFLRVFFDTVKNIIVTAGVAFAFQQVLNPPKKND